MTKRLLFDRNPADDAVRERMRRETADDLSSFTHRLPMKRKWQGGPRHWDPFWPLSVQLAAKELGFDVRYINDGLFTCEAEHLEAIKTRAEEIWRDKRDQAPIRR